MGNKNKRDSVLSESRHYISEQEASERYGLPVRTLQDWRARRVVLPYVKFGRLVRYRLSDLEAHIAKTIVHVDED